MAGTVVERVAALEHRGNAHDIEFRDLKADLHDIKTKLDALLTEQHRRDGALGLAKWGASLTFFTLLGSAIVGIFSFFSGRHP